MTRMWRPAVGGLILAMLPLPAAVAAQTAPSVEPSRVVKGFIQGGVYGWGEGAGFVFGGGVAASPSPKLNFRILVDGHLLGEPGYGTAHYWSGTLAYQAGDPDHGESWLVGGGMGFLGDATSSLSGPQLVVGFGYKAGFVQYRIVRFKYYTFGLLLGGVTF